MPTTPLAPPQPSVKATGVELTDAMGALLASIPGAPHRPTSLARRLDLSRVTVSKLLNALGRPTPLEVLQDIPGPESLRSVSRAAASLGVAPEATDRADRAIDRFAELIRDQFGTRSALNAAISPHSADLQVRFEHASRYNIFKGMRQVLGVEAETWLTSMLFTPSSRDDESLEVTTIHGALGMRRLRPDVNVYFTFGPPHPEPGSEPDELRSSVGLQEYYTNEPAPLETHVSDGKLVHRLMPGALGKHAIVDMLAVSHNTRGSRRFATPGRRLGGAAVFVDIPAKTLLCDVLLPEGVFPGVTPELIVYNPGARGPANPNDPSREIDRVDVPEEIESLGLDPERFEVAEVPRYAEMVERAAAQVGRTPADFRVFRVRMAYPVHGFQFVMAFEAPERPGA